MTIEWVRGDGYLANSYVCGNIMFDSGVVPMRVEKYKGQVDTIVITHCHYDHIAHIKENAAMLGAEIFIHEADAAGLSDDSRSLSTVFGEHSPGIVPDRLLKDGDIIGDFLVIHTPGHTPGGICLYNKETHDIISGDTLFSSGSFGRFDFAYGSRDDLVKSLEKLTRLEIAGIYCGHGLPARENGSAAAVEALSGIKNY